MWLNQKVGSNETEAQKLDVFLLVGRSAHLLQSVEQALELAGKLMAGIQMNHRPWPADVIPLFSQTLTEGFEAR
jgi:hypothetical protein